MEGRAIIREGTAGKRGMDDFAQAFFGVNDGDWDALPYTRDDVIATLAAGAETLNTAALLAECRVRMPAYMVPSAIDIVSGPLPRNPNGKIDRKLLVGEWLARQSRKVEDLKSE